MTSNANTEQLTETEEDWVQVGHYPTLQDAYDHGLVILAMGEACRVAEAEEPGEFDLHAEALPAAKISEELDAYGHEIAQPCERPPAAGEWTRHSPGWGFCALWMLTLIGFICVAALIAAGIMLIVSIDESLKDRAKRIVIGTLISLLIVVASYTLIIIFIP